MPFCHSDFTHGIDSGQNAEYETIRLRIANLQSPRSSRLVLCYVLSREELAQLEISMVTGNAFQNRAYGQEAWIKFATSFASSGGVLKS